MRTLLALAALLTGCGSPTGPRVAAASEARAAPTARCEAEPASFVRIDRCLEGDAAEVARLLVRAARLERTVPADASIDPAAYRALFTETSAGRTFARRRAPEESEWTLTPAEMAARIEGSRAQRWRDAEAGLREVEITARGDRAEVLARLGVSNGVESLDDEWVEAALVRRSGEWRIERLRAWTAPVSNQVPLQELQPDPQVLYDEAHWREADRRLAEARAAHEAAPSAGSRRRLILGLLVANRVPEAWSLARELTESGDADSGDWRRRAELAVSLGRLEDARLSAERLRAAPPPPAESWASMNAPCDAEDDAEDDEDEAGCRFHLLQRLPSTGDSALAASVLRMNTGVAEPAGRVLLAVAWEGEWQTLAELGGYVMAGNGTVGPIRFEVSAAQLTALDARPGPELRADYEEVVALDDGGSVRERGVLVCARLHAEPRCARLPTEIERRDAQGARTGGASAEVRFERGEVITRRLAGRDSRLRSGRRALEEVFEAAQPAALLFAR